MKLLLHLLRTDARHFRFVIAGTVLTVGVAAILDGLWPTYASQPLRLQSLGLGSGLFSLAGLLLVVLCVPLVMHAHPFVGSDAFWMTRPLPTTTVIASKSILLAGIVIVVPIACNVGVMSAYGVPAATIGRVALQSALWQTFWLSVFMAAAIITSSLAAFVLLCVGTLLSLIATLVVVTTIWSARIAADGTEFALISIGGSAEQMPRASDGTDVLVGLLLLTIAAAVAVALQARVRLRKCSVPAGIAGVAVAYFLSTHWPWPILQAEMLLPAWAQDESRLQLHGDAGTVHYEGYPDTEVKWRLARAPITLSGVEPGWHATVRFDSATLDLPSKGVLRSGGLPATVQIALDEDVRTQQEVVLTHVLDVPRVALNDSPDSTPPELFVFRVRAAEFARYAPAAGTYTGRALVDLTRKEIVATLPLEHGRQYLEDAYRFRIEDVSRAGGPVILRAQTYRASTIFDRQAPVIYTFFLRNRRLGEAVTGFDMSLRNTFAFSTWSGTSAGFGGFTLDASTIRFVQRSERGSSGIALNNEWLRDAELVIVRDTLGASVPRRLDIQNFPLRLPDEPPQ